MRVSPLACLSIWASAAGGCGLVDSDIATLSFALPPKSYSFDTTTAGWTAPPTSFPEITCGPGQAVADCCEPVPGMRVDCVATPLVCEQGACALRFLVETAQTMDLQREVPKLMGVNSQSLADVYISEIRYTYGSSLNVDLPPVDLYVAPASVMSASDPLAEKFGHVPAIPAMSSGIDLAVELDPAARAIFSKYARELGTPFNFIASTTVVVSSRNLVVPDGRVDITINGQVSAQPSF
jgi:hypothetical protein